MTPYEALKHAVKAHAGERDKCGKDAILHPLAVAQAIEDADIRPEACVIAALLHDVREDTDYEVPGLDGREKLVLDALTRRRGESYFDYIERICTQQYMDVREIACYVKLADLWHNLRPERQDCLPLMEQASLEERYLKARGRIWRALDDTWWPDL